MKLNFRKTLAAILGGLVVGTTAALAVPTAFTVFAPPSLLTLPLTALSANLAWTACDVSNGNKFNSTGREILLVWNTDSAPHTFTVSSAVDPLGRSGDITTYAIAATTISCVGPFPVLGWKQTDGTVHCTATDATVKFAAIKIPTSI